MAQSLHRGVAGWAIGVSTRIYYALVFLVGALIAGVLGFSGIAGTAANIAWILFVVGLVLAVVFFVRGRGSSI